MQRGVFKVALCQVRFIYSPNYLQIKTVKDKNKNIARASEMIQVNLPCF